MQMSKLLLPCIIGVALGGTASAEIYQTKDAQGNTVYSDTPSQGAEAIKLPKTNSADPVVEISRPEPTEAAPEKPRPAKTAKTAKTAESDHPYDENDDDYLIYGGSDDYDADDQAAREERREELNERRNDRPHVEHHRNTSRPAGRGAGRR
ncbi:MAG TPA: DUF4124 domain-containing protein, partial [Halioglobus sp.]